MLTKTLDFDDDVLDILKGMRVEQNNGSFVGVLTCGQLDRKMYERVNKALDAMGGKWTKKVGGHVFATDPRVQLGGLVDTGALTVERDGFFETPRAVVERMIELVPLADDAGAYYLEPSAGKGAIVRVLIERGVDCRNIDAIEKNIYRGLFLKENRLGCACIGVDFLDYQTNGYTRIYMNPPFEEGQDIDHVRHAYDLLDYDGMMVSVMGEGAFFRSDRKAREFREWLDEVEGESEQLPDGAFKESGTGVKARLVVIRK